MSGSVTLRGIREHWMVLALKPVTGAVELNLLTVLQISVLIKAEVNSRRWRTRVKKRKRTALDWLHQKRCPI